MQERDASPNQQTKEQAPGTAPNHQASEEKPPEEKPAPEASPSKTKTIGAKVPPELYRLLEQVRDRHKTGSLQKALVLAARHGVKSLLDGE